MDGLYIHIYMIETSVVRGRAQLMKQCLHMQACQVILVG